MLNEQKLKSLINKKAKEYGILPQQMYGLFGLEQLLVRISQLPFKDSFVIKGGYLLSSIYGLETRSTFDLDATIRRMPLTLERINEIIDLLVQENKDGLRNSSCAK